MRVMKKTEIILLFAAAGTLALRLLDVQISIIFFLLAFLILSSFYLLFTFALVHKFGFRQLFKAESYKNIKTHEIILPVIFGWLISVLIGGILFQVQNYPGADLILRVAMVPMAALHLFTYFKYRPKIKKSFYGKLFWRNLAFMFIGMFFIS